MKKIALVGGGTGGHITPLVSIYNVLKEEDMEFFWIGEKGGLEEDIANKNSIRFFPIQAGKLRRYFSLKTLFEPYKIIAGIFQSISILKKEKPDLIFSKGGFVSLPVAIAASLLGIRLYLHESDTIPGLANRYVGKFATKIFLGFPDAERYFDKSKVQVVGQILNPDLFNGESSGMISKNLALDTGNQNKSNLLIIAGSQGSSRIFNNLIRRLPELQDFHMDIVLGTLNLHFKESFDEHPNVTVYEFIDQTTLGKILESTDIAVTRAGATSLAELDAFGIKMIIVPLKESANNHQYHNAVYFKNRGHYMIEEKNLDYLVDGIKKLKGYKKEGWKERGSATEMIAEELRK